MERLMHPVRRFLRDETGPTAVEYAVMLAMIVLLCVFSIRKLGTTVSQSFSAANSMLQ